MENLTLMYAPFQSARPAAAQMNEDGSVQRAPCRVSEHLLTALRVTYCWARFLMYQTRDWPQELISFSGCFSRLRPKVSLSCSEHSKLEQIRGPLTAGSLHCPFVHAHANQAQRQGC